MFELLKIELEKDVENRNALREERSAYGFRPTKRYDSFTITRECSPHYGKSITASVIFQLDGEKIIVGDGEKQLLAATLTLNDEGECRFTVNGQERESWQLRKAALESLFWDF